VPSVSALIDAMGGDGGNAAHALALVGLSLAAGMSRQHRGDSPCSLCTPRFSGDWQLAAHANGLRMQQSRH
jgi:hypothetical protein